MVESYKNTTKTWWALWCNHSKSCTFRSSMPNLLNPYSINQSAGKTHKRTPWRLTRIDRGTHQTLAKHAVGRRRESGCFPDRCLRTHHVKLNLEARRKSAAVNVVKVKETSTPVLFGMVSLLPVKQNGGYVTSQAPLPDSIYGVS